MHYDFDKVIVRSGTNCVKWDSLKEVYGRDDLLPLWVADMDFPVPQPVLEAVQQRAAHPVYGYPAVPDSLYEAIIRKAQRHYGWRIQREWIVIVEGVVGGFTTAVKSLTQPGDNILVQPPVYHPFYGAIRDSGCHVNRNPLCCEDGHYRMDLEHLKSRMDSRTKALLFCSPHNPVGRVWRREELEALEQATADANLPIISDEIHCDLVLKPHRHTTLATLSPGLEARTITLISGSKTFNIAGLSTSVAIIPDRRLRDNFKAARGHGGVGNLFGLAALEAAYSQGDAYLEQLLAYLGENTTLFCREITAHLPGIRVIEPEGTYLVWVDFSALGLSSEELKAFLVDDCRLALNDGRMFGREAKGYYRFNLGCPRAIVTEALDRLKAGFAARFGQ